VNVTVSGGSGNPTPTGSVTLTGGGYTSATATLANGYITFVISAGSLAVGSDTLTVTYTPDSSSSATYNSATGTASVTVTAASAITGVSVSCTPTNVQINQNSQCAATVTGTGNYNSGVTWSVDAGTISPSGLYTAPATVPTSGTATVTAASVQDPTKTATAVLTITAASPAIGSLILLATPTSGGPGDGPWTLLVAARDLAGNPVSDATITLTASEGSLGPSSGVTDTNGRFESSITPPATYNSEAVAVSAAGGGQTVAVDIVFVPSSFSPAVAKRAKVARSAAAAASSGTFTTPFVFGSSSGTGTVLPWLTPNTCYSNISLGSTLSADCQSILAGNGLSQFIPNLANSVCKVFDTASNLAGAAGCVGVVATVAGCALSGTGVGAAICVGGLTYSDVLSDLCVGYITDLVAQAVTSSKTDQAAISLSVTGLEPDPQLGVGDVVGYACDAVEASSIGTGNNITVTPSRTVAVLGNAVQFTAQTTDNVPVDWSVNGIVGATGPFGSISASGLYTAPASLPVLGYVTVTATSQSDATETASAVIHILAAPAGTITTIAGNGTAGPYGDGGAAVAAELSKPVGVAFDGGGNMFIPDSGNNAVRRVDAATQIITTIAGTGQAGYSGDGGLGTNAEMNEPVHVVFDRIVNLYVTDARNERVREINSKTDIITTIAGNGVAGYYGDQGPATSAELNFPDGIAIDGNGNIYVGDASNNRVREINTTSGDITTVAGVGVAGYSGDGGPATAAELNFPSRPFVDANGNIYTADYNNNRVRKIAAGTGIITTVAGTGVAGYSGDGGVATSAELNGPISIAVDSAGVLYIGDTGNNRIRAVNLTANAVTVLGVTIRAGQIQTVVGNGTQGYAGDNGPATSAEVNLPTGLTFDPQGNLVFADASNNRVRKVIAQ
jgi:sugar lactone lactonase YvrE